MTGSTAFVVEIQALQKLLAEKDAEIERLKSWNQTLKQIVADDPEKHFYKVLLTRATVALERLAKGGPMSEAEVIARLYREINALKEERDAVIFTYNQADKECAQLRKMTARAADALEEEFGPWNIDLMTKDPWALIAELRKAAE
jgi:hypothetical protein